MHGHSPDKLAKLETFARGLLGAVLILAVLWAVTDGGAWLQHVGTHAGP